MAAGDLIILHITSPEGVREQSLADGFYLLGRQPGNDLVLDSPQVSRKHAQVEVKGGEVKITDLGSANGTRVDGEIIGQQLAFTLRSGSVIRIGPFEIKVEIKERIKDLEKPAEEPEDLAKRVSEPIKEKAVKKEDGEPPKKKSKPTSSSSGGGLPPGMTESREQDNLDQPIEMTTLPLGIRSQRFINYLPGIYHNDFMERFLGLFESMLLPIEWTIDNFDVFLDVDSSPYGFFSWLASWYGIVFNSTWTEERQRIFLKEAAQLYARRGTRKSLARMLEIYTGSTPEIIDEGSDIKPFHFEVRFKNGIGSAQKELVEQIIDSNKPGQSFYNLKIG